MGERYAPDGSAVELYALLRPSGEAEIVHAAIPGGASVLELGCLAERFDAVMLPSYLIHTADSGMRAAMLAAARRHTEGTFIGQWHPPESFDRIGPRSSERDGLRLSVGEVHREGDRLIA